MDTTQQQLETLFAKVRALPEAEQQAAVEALREIADVPYQLTEEELAVLRPALSRTSRQDFAAEGDVSELLERPWRKLPASGPISKT